MAEVVFCVLEVLQTCSCRWVVHIIRTTFFLPPQNRFVAKSINKKYWWDLHPRACFKVDCGQHLIVAWVASETGNGWYIFQIDFIHHRKVQQWFPWYFRNLSGRSTGWYVIAKFGKLTTGTMRRTITRHCLFRVMTKTSDLVGGRWLNEENGLDVETAH